MVGHVRNGNWRPLALAVLLLVLVGALAVVGGAGNAWDVGIIRSLAGWRHAHPGFEATAIGLTWAGSAYATLGGALAVALVRAAQRRRTDALWLVATVGGGRLLADGLKLLVDRPRPHFEPWPVPVSSFSFPSGHAANSMVAFTAIVVTLAPPSMRKPAAALAVLASLLVGSTRPLLGVHWPSDVIAGWCLGGAVLLVASWWRSARAGRSAA